MCRCAGRPDCGRCFRQLVCFVGWALADLTRALRTAREAVNSVVLLDVLQNVSMENGRFPSACGQKRCRDSPYSKIINRKVIVFINIKRPEIVEINQRPLIIKPKLIQRIGLPCCFLRNLNRNIFCLFSCIPSIKIHCNTIETSKHCAILKLIF